MRKVSRTVKKGQTPVPAVQRRACGARRESQKGYRARKSGPCRHRRALSPPGGGSKSCYRRRSDPAVQKTRLPQWSGLFYSALAILANVFERRQFLLRAWRHVKNLKGSVFPICDQRINTICARQIRQLSRYIEKAKRHAARARGSAPGEQNSERRRIKMRQRRAIDPIRACCDVHQTHLKRCAGIRLC